MADKGIGIKECPKHGEYHLDAPDSPCPSCEEEQETLANIHPDPNCCEIWPRIACNLEWHAFKDKPSIATMPHLAGDNGTDYFVNNCPSCGAAARNRKMLAADVIPNRRQAVELERQTHNQQVMKEIEKLTESVNKTVAENS